METVPLPEQTAVITGASSGIGRETALRFAACGARVVAASRNGDALDSLVDEIQRSGGRAIAVPTDVTRWEDVQRLAERAEQEFGRIDTWVNDAATTIYARFEDTTLEEFRRVIDVNLMGVVHGTRAALEVMKPGIDTRAAIINVASVEAEISLPMQSAYAASKHAVKGFSDAVRLEMMHEGRNIDVCVIEPSGIDTPLFEHARSKMGAAAKPISPVYDPKIVADAIVECARQPRRLVVVGGAGEVMSIANRIAGPALDWAFSRTMVKAQQADEPPPAADNLDAPVDEPGRVRGHYNGRPFSVWTWMRMHPGATAAAISVAAVPLLLRRRDGSEKRAA
jgi:NAD(P)-dependent dehydrogenase (short-subunit alcohol dehydrogenase family)